MKAVPKEVAPVRGISSTGLPPHTDLLKNQDPVQCEKKRGIKPSSCVLIIKKIIIIKSSLTS